MKSELILLLALLSVSLSQTPCEGPELSCPPFQECTDGVCGRNPDRCRSGLFCGRVRACINGRCTNRRCTVNADCSDLGICRDGICTGPCSGVTCPPGSRCDSATAFCTQLSCVNSGLCPAGSTCNNNRCVADVRTCDGVTCSPGLICRGGRCQLRTCTSDSSCTDGFFCRQERCVKNADTCVGVACALNEICSPRTGSCTVIRCRPTNNRCPEGTSCVANRCSIN